MMTHSPPPPDGDQNRRGEVLGACIGFLVVSSVFVVLRLYTRVVLIHAARWDDWTIALALLGSIVGAGLDSPIIHNGFGRHDSYLGDDQLAEFKRYTYGEWIQTFLTLTATKVSICLLLLRISPEVRIIRPIRGLIAFLILTNIILSLVWVLQCVPVEKAWDVTNSVSGKCFTQGQLQRIIISQAIISIISDFILAGFPIIILRKVMMNLRKKVLLCGLMGLGIFLADCKSRTAACCIVRTVMNWQNAHDDPTWVSVDNFVWRTAEVNIGIIAACLPTLLPLYRRLRDESIAIRERTTWTGGWFPRFLPAQNREQDISLQRAIPEPRVVNGSGNPQNSQWVSSSSSWNRATRDEDLEMQGGYVVPK